MGVRMQVGAMVLAMGLGCGLGMGQAADAPAVRLVLTLKGRGVQIYNCQRRPGEVAAWVLRAPEADLLDGSWNDAAGEAATADKAGPPTTGGSSLAASAGVAEAGSAAAVVDPKTGADEAGKVVGHHSAGPVWRLEDGSAVHGVVISKKDAPEAGRFRGWC